VVAYFGEDKQDFRELFEHDFAFNLNASSVLAQTFAAQFRIGKCSKCEGSGRQGFVSGCSKCGGTGNCTVCNSKGKS
jgi:RecJ-like exonuclease